MKGVALTLFLLLVATRTHAFHKELESDEWGMGMWMVAMGLMILCLFCLMFAVDQGENEYMAQQGKPFREPEPLVKTFHLRTDDNFTPLDSKHRYFTYEFTGQTFRGR